MPETVIKLEDALLHQAEMLARELEISPDDLIQRALEQFIRQHRAASQTNEKQPIHQGDIYWLQGAGNGMESAIPHPHLVIQDDMFNQSRLDTVVLCALTSNLKRATYPGNILLEVGEANLPKQSVVEISKLSSVKKAELGDYIGSLSESRIQQVLAGMRFQQRSFFVK